MNVFGVGAGEALLVLVIALMVVGPGRFPEIAREAGRWYRLARRYSTEVMADVRAAVDELESEVTAPGEDLRSIREIGTQFRNDLQEAGRSVSEIGRDTRAVAEQETSRALAAGDAPAALPTPGASPSAAGAPAEAETAADAGSAAQPGAASDTPAAPVAIRPSERGRPGAPVDPFEALAAERERERDADSAQI
ncbi:MAG: twin-arginine translocase TatA/TatE family subunit [Dehalococcoidia bacterium]